MPAAYDDSDFFIAGHWEGQEKAAGKPVIVKENEQDVTLIGLEPAFRDHTDYLYRLISNTLFTKQHKKGEAHSFSFSHYSFVLSTSSTSRRVLGVPIDCH